MSNVVVDEAETDFELTMPLVIVGGGACGLVAGLAALSRGIDAVVLERDSTPRGSTFMSSGFIPAAGTRFQKALGIDDSPAIMARDIQTKNQHQSDPEIVDSLANASAEVIEWLTDEHDVPFELVQGFLYPGHSKMRMHCTPRRSGEELMACLLNAAERSGLPVLTEALVKTLHIDDERRVRGISYHRPDGTLEQIGCDNLLLACNGYGGNPDLIEQFVPEMANALYYGHEGNKGDAVLWGQSLDATLKDMGAYQGHGSLAWPHQTLISWAVMMQGGIQLNLNGQRFSNEHGGYSEQAAKVIEQRDNIAFNIFDGRIHDQCLQFEDYRNAYNTGAVKTFDTLPELADSLGMPRSSVMKTFEDIHALEISGESDDFGRMFSPEQSLTPPYHAIRVTGALFHTQGGLEVTVEGRVIDLEGKPFPNLFAGGGAARGVSGSGNSGYLSGNGLLSAVVMGALAGRAAAGPGPGSATLHAALSL